MTTLRLVVGSWNVHGGVSTVGAQIDIAKVLTIGEFDLIALQEIPHLRGEGLVQEIAESLGLGFFHYWGVGSDDGTGVALISRWPIASAWGVQASDPAIPVTDKNSHLTIHRKGAIKALIDHGCVQFSFVSLHLLPFHIFGISEDSQEARQIWSDLSRDLVGDGSLPFIIAGDFNGPSDFRIRTKALARAEAQSALIDQVTRDDGRSHDDIVVSGNFRVLSSQAIQTESDHYLCHAIFELVI